MSVKWRCNICNNLFYFDKNDDRYAFMMSHSTYCCKVLHPNGVVAYVGPTNLVIDRYVNNTMKISMVKSNLVERDNVDYLHNVKNSDKVTKGWITLPESIGYATAKLLVILRDMYDMDLDQELVSLSYIDKNAYITELDREKAVKIYCTRNSLVDTLNRIVYIDELLYSILVDDDKLVRTMCYIMSDVGRRCYYIHTNSRNMYARQIACALRRLDKSICKES